MSDPLKWNDAEQDARVATLDYQLTSAVDSNRIERVTLLLEAGASPDTCNTYNGRAIHTNALLAGHTGIAKLLKDRGQQLKHSTPEINFNWRATTRILAL